MDQPSALQRAISLAGSEAKLAARIGFSQPAINKAKKAADGCSAKMAVAIDRALAPDVTKGELRPDLWPPSAPASVPEHAGVE